METIDMAKAKKQDSLAREFAKFPAYCGIDVIDLEWIGPYEHRFTLSNSTIHTVTNIAGVGWIEDRGAMFENNGKLYGNRVPDARLKAWHAQHLAWQNKQIEAKRAASEGSDFRPDPMTTVDSVPTRRHNGDSNSLPRSQETRTMSTKLKVKRAQVVAMFEALEYSTAEKWQPKRLHDKIQELPKLTDGDTKIGDEALQKLLKSLLKAIKDETEIEVIDGAADASEKKSKKDEKPAKSAKKSAKKEEAEEEEDDDEDEEEDADSDDEEEDEEEDADEEDEKPAKKSKKDAKPAKSAKKEEAEDDEDERVPVKSAKTKPAGKKTMGVCAYIVECFGKGTKDKPMSKEKVLELCVKKFPDRDPKAMKSTIGGASSWMATEKGWKVHKEDKGLWIERTKNTKD